jgi:hypothetical protein
MVAEIYRGTLDGVAFFVDNETKAPVLMKKRHPIASRVVIDTALAKNRDLFFAHPNLNEGGLDIEPLSDDNCIDAEGALFKFHYGHGLRCASKTPPRSSISSVSHFARSSTYIRHSRRS